MNDYYRVLGIEQTAGKEEIAAAFDAALADRRARRRKADDLHVAYAVLTDTALRRTYDLVRLGAETGVQLVDAKATAIGFAQGVIAEIDVQDLARQAAQVALKAVVLTSGATARAADLTARASRAVQLAASRSLKHVL